MSNIPTDMLWRGCAACFPAPVSEDDEHEAEAYVVFLNEFNPRDLYSLVYRSGYRELDILRHVFRWDTTPFEEVFVNGFRARRQENTLNDIYFNLDHYVHHGGRPLDSRRPATRVFVSTTLNSAWFPSLDAERPTVELCRYEIYAPGGIWVHQTLGEHYRYPAQDEVAFVAGIVPQYVRSAQRFRLTFDTRLSSAHDIYIT